MKDVTAILEHIRFDAAGLVPVIAQQHDTGEVLMMAWMNREAIAKTLETGQMHFWSRSRAALWRKGEESGQTQALVELHIDCDGDTLLAKVSQKGVACHTGRRHCFFNRIINGKVEVTEAQLVPPERLYGD